MARRKKPTVWQALNEPVIEITPEAARDIFMLAAFIMMMAWLAPYWGTSQNQAYAISATNEMVAGATIETPDYGRNSDVAPEWYLTIERASDDVVNAFAEAADQTLDISEPVLDVMEFYEPGVDAVWNAWLELMADPQFN